ncbi:MAG: hypothetical protein POELPBGB_03172 [Bacteroidia bacterium]|nr:hypothetical protein [Bacteroidia bacterium]
MQLSEFNISSNGGCKPSRLMPDKKSIEQVLMSSKKKWLETNCIIIARYGFLKCQKLPLPNDLLYPNLVLTIKEGKLIRACYTEVMINILKKQKYHIQIIN